jgi:hypothetical protein
MKTGQVTTLVIKYPNGAQQVVKPGQSFQGDWEGLARSVAGLWFRDSNGNIGKVTYELR